MQAPNRTKEDEEYIKGLSLKDNKYRETITRREVFRNLRFTMYGLGLNMPGGLTENSAIYCIKYGDPKIEVLHTTLTYRVKDEGL